MILRLYSYRLQSYRETALPAWACLFSLVILLTYFVHTPSTPSSFPFLHPFLHSTVSLE